VDLTSWEAKRIAHGYVWNPDNDQIDPLEGKWHTIALVVETQGQAQDEETIAWRLATALTPTVEC
jgi:hypothetical protein